MESTAYTMVIRCRRPIYGMVTNHLKQKVLGAFIAFDISFVESYASSRFKRAVIKVDFLDATAVSLNPHAIKIDRTYQPHIVVFEPQTFEGPVTRLRGQTSYKLELGVSDPTDVAGLKGSISKTGDYVRELCFDIRGLKRERDLSLIKWTLREDPLKKTGLPKEVESLGIIVSCEPGRKFAARVQIEADIRLAMMQVSPMAGKKDEPLFFTPPGHAPEGQLEAKLQEIDVKFRALANKK